MDYNDRPPSDQMVDIHVYLVPVEFWREQLNSAVNQIIEETISVGFVRVYPDSNLQDLRKDIATQLSDATLPPDYTFLRSVGRCLARVQAKQEGQLKAKNYIPPQAYAPEIFILEGPPDNRSSVGHPFSRWSADRSVQNSSDTVRTSRSDGPYKRLPAINNSRHQSPADHSDEHRNPLSDNEHSYDSPNSRSERRKSSDDGRAHDEDDTAKDNNQWDEDRWEQRPNSKDENRRDGSDNENQYDTNRERTLPPLSASPTQIERNEDKDNDGRRDNDPTPPPDNEDYNGHPLSATPPHYRRSSPKQRYQRRSRSTNSRRETSDGDRNELVRRTTPHHSSRSPINGHDSHDENKENRRDAWQDSYGTDKDGYDDKDRYEDRDRYEDHNNHDEDHNNRDDDNYRDNEKNGDAANINGDSTKRQFSSIQEEGDEFQNQHHRDEDKDRYGNRSPSRNSPRTGRRNSRSPDNNRQESIKDKGQLLRELEEAKRERQEMERKREELVKRAKLLQAQTQQKRNTARDIWKKKYFEEKKKTPPLEEQVNRLRSELENLHQRIISQLEGSKEEGIGTTHDKTTNFNNLKLQATKASHEITDLQRRVENVKMKLTGEIKLRKQAEMELKALKAELTQKKINLTLTRSQQLQNNSSSLSNSYNGFSTAR